MLTNSHPSDVPKASERHDKVCETHGPNTPVTLRNWSLQPSLTCKLSLCPRLPISYFSLGLEISNDQPN